MSKVALLVVDLVNDFTSQGGKHYYPETEKIMPNVCGLIEELHKRGVLVIYIQQITPASAGGNGIIANLSCVEGTGGELLDSRLPVTDQDEIVVKRKPSGFFETDLQDTLQRYGVDTVALAGTKTNYCVRATATDAMMRDYKVYVISDCVSTNTAELNQFHLKDLAKYTAKVIDSQGFLHLMDSGEI